ncbi:MAG: diguanylate cyclase [Fusobacteriaceae bacterium]|nr:diguanylate cyclase [Fusobacteriaceae bacterium]
MEDISNIPTNDYQSDSLNFILHLIPNFVVIIDLQSGFIKFENEKFSLLGISKKSLYDFIIWESSIEKSIFFEKINNERYYSDEIKLRNTSNDVLFFNFSSKKIKYDNQDALIIFLDEISHVKQLENLLMEKDNFLQNILENTNCLIYTKTLEGKFNFANSKWREFLQLDYHEFIGKKHEEVFNNKSNIQFENIDLELIKNNSIFEIEEIIEKNNEKNYFSSIKFPLKDIYNNIIGIGNISTDITSYKITENKIEELAKLLKVERDYALKKSTTDALTEVYNRGHFDEMLVKEFHMLKKYNFPLSLIMLDIDYFKKYNDYYGHQKGDECLRKVAQTIKNTVQKTIGTIARYGGEEFVIILPNISNEKAFIIAENIRINISNLELEHKNSPISKFVTVSLGVSTAYKNTIISGEHLIGMSDVALYNAKEEGRNRTRTASINLNQIEDPNFLELKWNSLLESGNKIIDDEHKELMNSCNRLIKEFIKNQQDSSYLNLIDSIIKNTEAHFLLEEKIFSGTNFPLTEYHKVLHKDLILKGKKIVEKYQNGNLSLQELITFVAYDLFSEHIILEDTKFFPYLGENSEL